MKIYMIMATSIDGGIGYDNGISWYIKEDLKKFKDITSRVEDKTKRNAIIMGKNTWLSMPKKPLPNRLNIILTSDTQFKCDNDNIKIFNKLYDAISYCDKNNSIENVYIIGGSILFNKIMECPIYRNIIDKIYLSVVFYNVTYINNKFIDIYNIFKYFKFIKDDNFKTECDNRLFASYICIPYKKILHKSPSI